MKGLFTQEDLQALKDAYMNAVRTGVMSVTYGDKSVTYASLADMRAAITAMEAQVNPQFLSKRRQISLTHQCFGSKKRFDW